MTEPESNLPPSIPPSRSSSPARRLAVFCVWLGLFTFAAGLLLYLLANSGNAQNLVRRRVIASIEESTGGRVDIATFHWHLFSLEADADGLVLHGREASTEEPLARIRRMRAGISIFGIWSPRILLRELEIEQPAIHLIVYPDGSTNVPHPHKPRKESGPVLDSLFELKADHVSLQQGTLNFENRQAEFDFQNRFTLLALDAHDVSALLRYIPAGGGDSETYRIETGATDIRLARGNEKPALGSMQATLDLSRSLAMLHSLRITTGFPAPAGHRTEEHSFEISGTLHNFSRPAWQARITGDLDMRVLEPSLGYPFAPQGIARLDLESAGEGAEFRTDGSIHVDDASYIGTGVVATGIRLDAHVHADPRRLLINRVVARLRQGGQLEGEVDLSPWLPTNSTAAALERSGLNSIRATGAAPHPTPSNPNIITIPVNGRVTANFKDISLDALLDMVGQSPFQRLGFDSLLNGVAVANWNKGDQQTIAVDAKLEMNPSAQPVSGEVPATGAIDATYTQRDGGVDVRKLELHLPASQVEATGHLGAYPLTSPSGLSVDFHSRNLSEFDALLRDLGLNRYGHAGAAALPINLTGQGDFHGNWTGSLIDPHLSGTAKATQISIEVPAANSGSAPSQELTQSRPPFFHLDSVEATGSYTGERITIQHGVLKRGVASIAVDGTLDATPPASPKADPAFDGNSTLHAHLSAAQVDARDLLQIAGEDLPLTGTFDAQIQVEGQLHAPDGSGSIELNHGSAWNEPFNQLHAQGTLAKGVLHISSGQFMLPAGDLSATGSYDLHSRQFQIDFKGSGIDIARIESLNRENIGATGTLGFSLNGSGTIGDPRLDAHATLNNLMLGGESLGALVFAGHTRDHSANYNASTRLEGAMIDLNGETALNADCTTQATLQFSHFDIGGLLKTAHVRGLSGESALAGILNLGGPLAHPLEMHGEARLQQLAATVAGVHLESQGGVHATLANGLIHLDPLHVTGEDTDLQAQGSLALKDKQQLDFAASGSVNLKLAETIDTDLTASGTTTFQFEAHGPLANPGLQGRVDFENGALSLEDVPNGLSQLHGSLQFNKNRLEVTTLTAMSGGGLLSVGGYLSWQHGLFADLSVNGKGIRIRYPTGVSSLADANLHLQGSQSNLLLSGDVLITRFTISPDFDITSLATQTGSISTTVVSPDAPSNHIRLDVQVNSSPQLNFQNAYAKLAGNVNLRLRGTLASPSLLGRVSITEGNAIIAGTRYDLQRGDILFTNPVRIEPTIDLNATARVEDYDITLGLHGTPQKLAVTYRSDPPLPEQDVVALLALGRTENQQRLYTQQQEQSVANPTTDALLGGALNATVSSRVQKLFGAGSVKVDPNYIGTLGNSTSRITVEEQVGRNLTLTFATDVDTTSQQLLQAEIAINRHVSVLVARDESGVFSMVLKATRRYR